MAVLLAALSAITYGVSDFLGGLSARRIAAAITTLVGQLSGMVLIVAVAVAVGGDPGTGDLTLGAGAGLLYGVGLVAYYRAMATGVMSVVAPVSAVTTVLVPVVAGIAGGERPPPPALVGVVAAAAAILLISREPDHAEARVSARPVAVRGGIPTPLRLQPVGGRTVTASVVAGTCFGSFFVVLGRTGEGSGMWPVVTARLAAIVLVGLILVVSRPRRPRAAGVRLALAAGVLDAAANAVFLVAARQGLLSLVGVVAAMYPASTVLLARTVLGERLARHQLVGLVVAAGSVAVIASA